ncbi:MAG: DUF423 domain-containing protein [Myxococcales bacterium]|nr:DUF423 domain-containing protein [Myxococcales bacterium]
MWMTLTALLGAAGVALGAFGAHGLKGRLGPSGLATWQTAVEYHLIHVVALLALVLFGSATGRSIQPAAASFVAGIVLFSGSLYALALGGPRWLGPVTPLGGLAFIVGWLALAWVATGKS